MDIFKLQIRSLETIVLKNINNKYKQNYKKLFKYCNGLNVFEKAKFFKRMQQIRIINKKDSTGLYDTKNKCVSIPKNNNISIYIVVLRYLFHNKVKGIYNTFDFK